MAADFTQIQNDIIRTNKLDVYQKSFICNILSNEDGFKVSLSLLADRIPCTKRKVILVVKSLEQLEVLKVINNNRVNGKGINSYQINFVKLQGFLGGEQHSLGGEYHSPGGEYHSLGGEYHSPGGEYHSPGVVNDMHIQNTNKNTNIEYNYKNTNTEYNARVCELKEQYEKCFRNLTTVNKLETLYSYLENGLEIELIKYAMQYTDNKEKDFSYCLGVLNKCVEKNIKTVEEFDIESKNRYKQFNGGVSNGTDRASAETNYNITTEEADEILELFGIEI